MSKSTKHTVKNTFRIGFMILGINFFALGTQHMLNTRGENSSELSITEYTHKLIKGNITPLVFAITNTFLD